MPKLDREQWGFKPWLRRLRARHSTTELPRSTMVALYIVYTSVLHIVHACVCMHENLQNRKRLQETACNREENYPDVCIETLRDQKRNQWDAVKLLLNFQRQMGHSVSDQPMVCESPLRFR